MKIDFADVEERLLVPAGQYKLQVVSVTEEESDAGNLYLSWKLKVIGGPDFTPDLNNAMHIYLNTSLKPKALWKLRQLLKGMGLQVPKGVMDVDLRQMKNNTLEATVINTTWEGKKKAEIEEIIEYTPPEPVTSYSVGSEVEFTMEGKVIKGKIIKLTHHTAVVKTDEGVFEMTLGELKELN